MFFCTDGLIERYGTGQRRREDCLVNFIEACVETRDLPVGSAMGEIVTALCPDERTLQDDVLLLGVDLYAGFTMDLNEVFLEQRHSHSHGEIEDMNATFEVRTVSDHLSILFFSALEKIDAVNRETEKLLSHLGIQEKAFRILLSMREALTNMILHGNQENPQKLVHYRVHVEEGDLVIEVKDQGVGFDWKRHMERKPRANAESSRSLFIMQQFASDVRFNDRGNHLVLLFR